MIFLLLSISCSVTVGVLLKFAKRYHISVIQAITWNYFFAILLSLLFFRPEFSSLQPSAFKPIFVALGILLPVIFLVQGYAVQFAGLARTDIAQRLSLFISMGAAYFLFGEHFDRLKYAAMVFGFIAIVFTLFRSREKTGSKNSWFNLLLVFVGFGMIDVLFKLVSQVNSIPYTTSLFLIFCIAFALSLLYILYGAIMKRQKLQLINFICGCILGFFNFGNILFYLKAHRAMADSPFLVFATMNLGVIIMGSLIGIFSFKEKLSKINYIGLALAVLSVVLLTLAKIYAV